MTDWNFADVWETVADTVPDAPAFVHGDRRTSWADLERRANGVARTLLEHGVKGQDKVAQYLYNGPEYLESVFAAMKVGLVPVNTNYRYTEDELVYLWDNADAVAVVFHGAFADRIEGLLDRVPRIKTWLWVGDGEGDDCPPWAIPYEQATEAAPDERVSPPWGRSGDDLIMLYTGGTTGMPKGVMWRQDDLFCRLNAGNLLKVPEDEGLPGVRKTIVGPGPVLIPACPLMHGTGAFTSMGVLCVGGCVVTLTNRKFDPVELLETVDSENV
ncbi:MAG: AMP-binding protein, partial [Acidimicrobiales bacterium]